ncbi:MAG: PEP-CTERM sorting domain-containing protein [Verrucomicrobiota bacterium]
MTTSQSLRFFGICLGVGFLAGQDSHAWTYDLTSGNSSVTIKADGDAGMSGWTVDCVPQLYRQWFWYRVGSTGGEKGINQLNLVSVQQTGDNTLTTLYKKNNQFSVEISYTLLGGLEGSGSSQIGEQIKILNLSGGVLDFHFFQYVDFDLGGSNAGDTVQIGQNISGLFDSAYQNKGSSFFADEIVSPGAQHGQVGLYPSIYNSLTNGTPTTLSDATGPITGDATWAFQWDTAIPVNGSLSIALNKSVYVTNIPEPSSLALIPVALVMVAAARRRLFSAK